MPERYYGCEIRIDAGRYKVYRAGQYIGSSPTKTGARKIARWTAKPETMPRG